MVGVHFHDPFRASCSWCNNAALIKVKVPYFVRHQLTVDRLFRIPLDSQRSTPIPRHPPPSSSMLGIENDVEDALFGSETRIVRLENYFRLNLF